MGAGSKGAEEPVVPGPLELRLRLAGLRGLEVLYQVGARAALGLRFLLGGFVPVAQGWLANEISDWSEAADRLGAIRVGRWAGSPDADHGPVLTRGDAPKLFDEIDEICRRLGVRRPAQIRIAYLPCCGITVWARDQALLIGLPLLEILTAGEIRAVLAHELAHLAYGDVTTTSRAMRLWEGLSQALDEHPRGVSAWWARRCLGPGLRLLGPVAQGQEIRADRVAAALAGGSATASALVKVALAQSLFREVLDHFDPSNGEGLNLYACFRDFWSRLPEPLVESLRHSLLSGGGTASSRRDPHPPLLDRLRVVQGYPDRWTGGRVETESPIPALVGDLESLETMMHNRVFHRLPTGPSVFHRSCS